MEAASLLALLAHGRRRWARAVTASVLGVAAIAAGIGCGVGCRDGERGRVLLGARHGARSAGLSPEDRKVVARTALAVMARLAEVRAQVRADQPALAADGLERARGLTQLIAGAAPTFTLRERVQIVRTHLSYEAAADVVHELVPIQRELEELGWLLPIQEADEHLRRARTALAGGDKDAASRHLEAVAESVVFQEIDLPLKEVDSDIAAAQEALQLRRLDEVDALLGRAESSLDVLTVWASEEDVPARGRKSPEATP